jgi:choice-of-anchor B domain-containing protein
MMLGKIALLAILVVLPGAAAMEPSDSTMYKVIMPYKMAAHANGASAEFMKIASEKIKKLTRGNGEVQCDPETNLIAGTFPCKNMNLAYYLTGQELGSPYAFKENPLIYSTWVSDIWGWVDSKNGKEYALVGMWDGTSVVDISNPSNPEVICFIETTRGVVDGLDRFNNIWRDIKVVNDVMYIGSEVSFHGIQTFDLTKLQQFPRDNGDDGVPIISPDYVTPELGSTHNLVAAPEAGMIIAVGVDKSDKTCPAVDGILSTLVLFDVSKTPVTPTFERCVYLDAGDGGRGYAHDAHCIKYNGPDEKYKGVNVCALSMESEIVFYNLDDLVEISRFTYETAAYVHQGWFSEDHTVFYADDELDELFETTEDDFSRCYIFDVTDLENPRVPPTVFVSPTDHPSIDHNLYVKDGYIYQAAYTSGARIRKIVNSTTIEEVAYFDGELNCECVAEPDCTCDYFAGTWTYFPYFDRFVDLSFCLFLVAVRLTSDSFAFIVANLISQWHYHCRRHRRWSFHIASDFVNVFLNSTVGLLSLINLSSRSWLCIFH